MGMAQINTSIDPSRLPEDNPEEIRNKNIANVMQYAGPHGPNGPNKNGTKIYSDQIPITETDIKNKKNSKKKKDKA